MMPRISVSPAGLTLILGIMDFVFLAHGAQVMIGAYAAATLTAITGNFFIGILLAIPITFASGFLLEFILIRHLYRRDHMDQVLATFGPKGRQHLIHMVTTIEMAN